MKNIVSNRSEIEKVTKSLLEKKNEIDERKKAVITLVEEVLKYWKDDGVESFTDKARMRINELDKIMERYEATATLISNVEQKFAACDSQALNPQGSDGEVTIQ